MSIAFATLIDKVKDKTGLGDPELAVITAVAEFSSSCGMVKSATLSIVSGTATYNLPVDFLPDGVIRLFFILKLYGGFLCLFHLLRVFLCGA